MSAYTNGLAFWKHFEEKQGAIINCLKAEQYEELNELIQELDEEVMEISGAHFFVESFYDSFEMTFDTGPNKTTQYLCEMLVYLQCHKRRFRPWFKSKMRNIL